jgi:hypothetical protein
MRSFLPSREISEKEKTKASIPDKIIKNASSIRTVFEIISHLLNIRPFTCDQCQSTSFDMKELSPVRPKNKMKLFHQSFRAPPSQNPLPTIKNIIEYPFSMETTVLKR